MVDAAETKLLDSVPDGLFIGGEWAPATSGATLKVYDPATGEVIKAIADADVADGAAAMDAAVDAAADWAKTPPRERAELGIEAMSLYYHLPGKESLLDGVVDAVIGEIEAAVNQLAPAGDGTDWRTALRQRFLTARDVMLRHPWAPGLIGSRTSVPARLYLYYDGIMATLIGVSQPL